MCPPADNGLFRRAAVVAHGAGMPGEGSNPLALSHGVAVGMAAAVCVAVVALLFFGKYAARETVRGYITTTQANVRVRANGHGVVAELFVRDGDQVGQGEALLRVSNARTSSGIEVDAEVVASMRQQLANIAAERQRLHARHAARYRAVDAELASTLQQLAELERQIQLAAEQAELQRVAYRRIEALVGQGHLPRQDLLQARALGLERDMQQAALRRERLSAEARLGTLQAERDEQPRAAASQLGELAAREEQLFRQLAEAQARAEHILTAPVAGRVSGLSVHVGESVNEGNILLALLPLDAHYSIELLVPGRATGLVATGDALRVRVDAFPHRRYGFLRGEIITVSQSVIRPGERTLPLPVREASYLVQVRLAGSNPPLPLREGMTVMVDLMGEKRRVLDWMLEPAAAALERFAQ